MINKIKTIKTKTLMLKGEQHVLPVYRIRIDNLKYNVLNDRINAELSGVTIDKLDSKNINDKIEDILWSSQEKANKRTYASIREIGQQEAGVVTESGIIIDGNRRFTCMRKLYKNTHDTKFSYIEAVILDESLNLTKKEIKTLELNIQHRVEEREGYDPINRAIAVNRAIDSGMFTFKEYAFETGMKESDVKKQYNKGKIINEFLKFHNLKENYLFVKEGKLDGPISDIESLIGINDEYQEERTILYDYMIHNIKGTNWKDIRPIIKGLKDKNLSEDFKEKYYEIADDVECELEEGKSIDDIVRNSDLNKKMKSCFEELSEDVNIKENTTNSDIHKFIRNTIKKLEQIDNEELEYVLTLDENLNNDYSKLKAIINQF